MKSYISQSFSFVVSVEEYLPLMVLPFPRTKWHTVIISLSQPLIHPSVADRAL